MKTVTEQDYRERIRRTLSYIEDRLDDALDLDQVAGVAAFSPYHFHRIFRAMVGEGLMTYVRRLRLERAARELKQGDRPVTQIAFDAGFETHEAFTRAFGDRFGQSPSAYRAAAVNRAPEYREIPPVAIEDLPAMRLLFLRHVGPYAEVGQAWWRLMSWAGMRGMLGPNMKLIGIVHDDPEITPADKVRYDAAVTVDRAAQAEGEFGILEIAASKYGLITHRGPYDQMSATYQQLYGGWLPKSGYEPADSPAFEQYLNSPQDTKPEDLLTKIHVPLKT